MDNQLNNNDKNEKTPKGGGEDEDNTTIPTSEEEEYSSDILKENEKLKNQVEKLKAFHYDLQKEYEEKKSKRQAASKELIEWRFQLGETEYKIENSKKNNKCVNLHEIKHNCKKVISKFVQTIKDDSSYIFLSIRVVFRNMTFVKRLEDDSMDFKRMKLELTKQVDMEPKDFYFTDTKGHIFIDELNVKKALFAFNDCKIVNFEPTIKVVLSDKIRKFGVDMNKIELTNNHEGKPEDRAAEGRLVTAIENNLSDGESIHSEEDEENFHSQNSILYKLKEFFTRNVYEIFNLITFLVFIVLWIESGVKYRKIDEYRMINLLGSDLFGPTFLRNDYNVRNKL